MTRSKMVYATGLALVAASCTGDTRARLPLQASVMIPGNDVFSNSYLAWNGVVAVRFVGDVTPSPAQEAAVVSALLTWSSLFNGEGVPLVSTEIDDDDATYVVRVVLRKRQDVPGTYCGANTPGINPEVELWSDVTDCGGGGPWSLERVAAHEIGQALGFTDMGPLAAEWLQSCIAKNPSNSSPCPHEEQGVYWYYGLRETEPDIAQALFGSDEYPVVMSPIEGLANQASSALLIQPAFPADWQQGGNVAFSGPTVNVSEVTITAGNPGTAYVTATLREAANLIWPTPVLHTGTFPIWGPVATVQVSPAEATLTLGDPAFTFAARAFDVADNDVTHRTTFNWSSTLPTIATVDNSGTVTARAAGQTTIAAVADGHAGNALITVDAPPPPPITNVAIIGAFRQTGGGTSNVVRPNQVCIWEGSVTGGVQPLQFNWQRRKGLTWLPIGEGWQTLDYFVTGAFDLRLVVTDAANQSRTSPVITVTASSSGIVCLH